MVVDPNFTETAQKADEWIPIQPGADGALALADVPRHRRRGSVRNRDFVSQYCEGFDGFRDHLRERGYTPEWAEPITGVAAERIRRIAREFATTKPAMSAIFKGSGYYTNGADAGPRLLHPRRHLRRNRQAGQPGAQGLGPARCAGGDPRRREGDAVEGIRFTPRWATRLRRICPIRACRTLSSTAIPTR